MTTAPLKFKDTSNFETILKSSKDANDYMPVWELFVNTKFFVPIIRDDNEESITNFKFLIIGYPESNSPSIVISEQRGRLTIAQTDSAVHITGAQLLKMLNPEVGIILNTSLPEFNLFGIPKEITQWLNKSIQTT